MPGWAPSTPASHDPSVDATCPFSYSAVCSPRYQMLPSASWAYQSRVSSTTAPSGGHQVVHDAGLDAQATVCVSSSTVTSTRCTAPSASVSA